MNVRVHIRGMPKGRAMTEAEWLACGDPSKSLGFLNGQGSDRKMRLFAVACGRRLVRLMPGKAVRSALETAERFADGGATVKSLKTAGSRAWAAQEGPFPDDERAELGAYALAAQAVYHLCRPPADLDICKVLDELYNATACDPDDPKEEDRFQAALIRDILGNPFRSVTFSESWRTDTAVSLARQMYESRDFSAMPILADALQDTDCDSDDVLGHCRGDGPHVRGCWVVDAVLNKG